MLFDQDPIPLNLYLGATLRFFQAILHTLMDLVAAAQLIFPVICTDASLLSNCSAHVTEMLLCCSAFASIHQKSQVASSHNHISMSSISSVQQKSRITTRLRCSLTLPAWFFPTHPHHQMMSHASLSMQQQLLFQYCHWQCAFLTCVCFWEDKESTRCWPWQVPSVLVGFDADSQSWVRALLARCVRKLRVHNNSPISV